MGSKRLICVFFQAFICSILSLQEQPVNLSRFEDKVVKISFKDHVKNYTETRLLTWSLKTAFNQTLVDNREGRMYIALEPTKAAMFRLLLPGLHRNSSSEIVSFQLFGHPEAFLRQRPDGWLYLDRRNESLEFNMSASFEVLKSNYSQFIRLNSITHPGQITVDYNSYRLFMSPNGSKFQIDLSSDDVEDDNGFTLRRWLVPIGSSPETRFIPNPLNYAVKIANILPYKLSTVPGTFYRIQGYWRPYFNGAFTFSLSCDVPCRLILEQDNHTVTICSSTNKCKPMSLHGGPTSAYYYVELTVFSEKLAGTVNIDIIDEDQEVVKFAQFKKIERTRESHRWIFSKSCSLSCLDELQLSSLERNNEDEKLRANHLILNREHFIPGNDNGFSIGFWFSKLYNLSTNGKKEILSYGSDFRVWFNSTSSDPALVNFTNFMFDIGGKRFVISTSREIVHIVFTYSHRNRSRCYINGEYVKWDGYSNLLPSVSPSSNHSVSSSSNHSVSSSSNHSVSSSSIHPLSASHYSLISSSSHSVSPSNHSSSPSPEDFLPEMERLFSVSTPFNEYFNLSELFLWSSEMTTEQVLEEYQVSCNVNLSTCRWKNSRHFPNQWLFYIATSSYPFTGLQFTGNYFYIDGSTMDYNASAILLSPKIVSGYQCLSFQYFMYGMGIGRLSVYVEQERRCDIYWSLAGQQQERDSHWKKATVSLPFLEKDAWRKISFHAVRGENFRSDIAIFDMKLHAESCQTSPQNAWPGWSNASCPNPCPPGIPCIKSFRDNRSCLCDTRLANFVNQFCLNDIENSLYRNALYYWSMDDVLARNSSSSSEGDIQQNLVTGVANKAVEFKTEWSQNISTLKNFSVSMWVKITRPMIVFKISRLCVTYDNISGLLEINITHHNQTCRHRVEYEWPWGIFVYLTIVAEHNNPKISLFKNGELQTRRSSSGCCSSEVVVDENIRLFPGNTFDDVSVWSTMLSQENITEIYKRYGQYKTIEGEYKPQPIIFKMDGFWTESVKNARNKDSVLNENYQRKLYDMLKFTCKQSVSDITVSTGINSTASITVFMSSTAVWRQDWLSWCVLLAEKRFADVIMDYNVTSRYVSDKPPFNLKVQSSTAHSVNLRWEFMMEEKLSPFRGFIVAVYRRRWSYLFTTANEVEVVGLNPNTLYEIRVIPQHLVGMGFISKYFAVTTNESVPTMPPAYLYAKALSSSRLMIQWASVNKRHRNGVITGYNIFIVDESNAALEYIKISSGSTFSYEKHDLKPYHLYKVKISAMTKIGLGPWSEATERRTLPGAPSASPANFTGVPRDHKSISFTWHEVPSIHWNSASINYTIRCCDNGIKCTNRDENLRICCVPVQVKCVMQDIPAGHSSYNLTGLRRWTSYNCSISASNEAGLGPPSYLKVATMRQVYKKSFLNVTETSVTFRSIFLRWTFIRPDDQDSSLYLRYQCFLCSKNHSTRLDITKQKSIIIDDLMAHKEHQIYVYEFYDGKIRNCSVTLVVKTAEDVPPPPQNVTVQSVSSTEILLQWSRPPYGHDSGYSGLILGYNVVLVHLVRNISHYFPNVTDNNFTGNNLKKYHNYSLRVAAFTTVGEGKFSPWVQIRTLEDVPSAAPKDLNVSESVNSSLLVTWTPIPEEHRNGVILGYDLIFLDKLIDRNETVRINGSNQLVFVKKGLKKHYYYLITIAGRTSIGVSREASQVQISNIENVPPPPPQNISIMANSSTSLKMTWSIVMLQHFHHILKNYEIRLKDVIENTTQRFKSFFNQKTFFYYTNGLKKYHNYTMSLAVESEGGISEFSSWVDARTLSDIPCVPPRHINVSLSLPSLTYELTWSPLNNNNEWCGEPRGYRILYGVRNASKINYTAASVSPFTNTFLLPKNLTRFVTYVTSVAAFTTVGEGASVSTAIYINDVPTIAPVLSVETVNSTSLRVQWSSISSKNGKANFFIIQARCLGCHAEQRNFTIPHISRQVVLNGLRIYSNYSVQIAALNEFGQGNFSHPVFALTDETVPKRAPENVTYFSTAPNNLTVYWSALMNTWGEIRYYRVCLYQNNTLLHNTTTQDIYLAFTGLKKDTEYLFRVQGATSKGEGPGSGNSQVELSVEPLSFVHQMFHCPMSPRERFRSSGNR
ncbi:uncharacterized protein LOC114517517 [Dendronephthya gigantea]|uniref:uncharacterized protein LOC114517517 n=1 Tax=Dendronephthya gigantea TaxID=151771 RepID=UPI0010693B8C|nr:uncharacterized protein LOC114517517 [Dendronephthya gigantea]